MKKTPTLSSQPNVKKITALAVMMLLPALGLCKNHITTPMLLESLKPGEPWDKGVLASPKTVLFKQGDSGSTNASVITKTQLGFFTSNDCSGSLMGSGFYVTPATPTFPITVGTPFGLTAAATWNVGVNKLGIATGTMSTVGSIAMTFKTTASGAILYEPQSNFAGSSFACIPVTCSSGACTSISGTQDFTLKTTAAVGDPADGGVIACMGGGLNNLVAPTTNNNAGAAIQWGGENTVTGATSATNGAANTTTIVNCLTNGTGCTGGGGFPINSYAAGVCSGYASTGGYTSGWFLPAEDISNQAGQLDCLYTNRASIGGFGGSSYWSSTEFSGAVAYTENFSTGGQPGDFKNNTNFIRCVRALTL